MPCRTALRASRRWRIRFARLVQAALEATRTTGSASTSQRAKRGPPLALLLKAASFFSRTCSLAVGLLRPRLAFVRPLQPQAVTAQCARPGSSDSHLARLAVSSTSIRSSIRSSACGATVCRRLESRLRFSECRLGSSSSGWSAPLIGSVE
jgi:hypothetical protein